MSFISRSGKALQDIIIDNISTAVLMVDHKLSILYINAAGEMMLDISSKRAVGQSLRHIINVSDAFFNRLETTYSNNHPYSEHELSVGLFSGKELTIDYSVTPIMLPGLSSQLLLEFTSIDRHLRIAHEENLLAQHQATRSLIRGMAHEIKNPLGGLRGAAQLLENELPEPSLKEYTDIIIGEADRLRNLVDRMIGPNNLPKPRLINVHEVIERVRQLVSAEVDNAINLKRDYDPSLPLIIADPDQLIQAILNITRNAILALNDHGTISFRTRPRRQYTIGSHVYRLVLEIQIIDDGPGIAEDLIENIFYPMISGRPDGSGIGLSISQGLINQHKGLIECQSEPGNTVFTILLPLENGLENINGDTQ
ncbi:MAG: nitrogen regulation protein NR(II) [Gammaproteobacteria bacterium]|nr:nitrogen regulation protein NR(II) [Gammaproteobacteria bacterium]